MSWIEPGKFAELFPGAQIHPEARIKAGCKIEAGCQIGPQAELGEARLSQNVSITGAVRVGDGVILREAVVLAGPVEILSEAALAAGVEVGLRIAPAEAARKPTLIGWRAQVGRFARIAWGVTIERYARIRSGSQVNGDVLEYCLAGGAPAALENMICPQCGNLMRARSQVGKVTEVACRACPFDTRIGTARMVNRFGHVCLPDWGIGPAMELDPFRNLAWDYEREIRGAPGGESAPPAPRYPSA